MKKIISAAVSSVVLLSCFTVTAAATNEEKKNIPFELEPPTKLSLTWLEENDSLTSSTLAYSMNDSMCQWLSKMAEPTTHDEAVKELNEKYKLNDLYVNIQIDWAIDDPENGWHYTKYWDGETFKDGDGNDQWAGLGHDKDYQTRTGEWDIVDAAPYAKTVNDIWIFRGLSVVNNPEHTEEDRKLENEWFYGNDLIPGLKNQLKDDQYTLVEIDPETHDQAIKIDFTQHTAYVRARWAVVLSDSEDKSTPLFSDWSETASSGKDAEKYEPLKKEDVPAPKISGLRYYPEEFNGYPQIACTLDVPEELSKKQAEVVAHGGGMRVYWEARVPGGEWIEQQAGGEVTAGENVISLLFLGNHLAEKNKENSEDSALVLEKDSPVELRARFWVDQYDGYLGDYIGEIYSDYSEVLTFGSQEMSKTEESVKESSEKTESKAEVKTENKTEEKKCSLCGFCPQPLGLCIFIWIAILVVIAIVVVIVILAVKKNKSGDKEDK